MGSLGPVSRRELLLDSLVTFALLETLFARRLLAQEVRPTAEAWVRDLRERCCDLHRHALEPREWQTSVERLFAQLPLLDLLRAIEFERLAAGLKLPDDRAGTRDVTLPEVRGLSDLPFVTRVFGLKKGRAIVPHGHRNMASGHLIVKGEMHVRHFDRLRDEEDCLILAPTIDRVAKTGNATTISDQRDNVHWLTAESDTAYTFDVIVVGLDPSLGFDWRMDYVDVRARPSADGTIRAPRIDAEEAFRRFGKL
jgi:hypothetical protein